MSHTGKGKFLPVLLAVLCVALAVILAAGAVLVYLDGAPRRAENPLENIYTAEKAGRVMTAALPVFLMAYISKRQGRARSKGKSIAKGKADASVSV